MVVTFFHQRICQFLHTAEGLQKNLIGNHHLIDLKTFVDLHQMGRGEQTAFIAPFLQHGGDKSTDAAFPIGSRYVDDLFPFIRTS